jgi:hypothetical protein
VRTKSHACVIRNDSLSIFLTLQDSLHTYPNTMFTTHKSEACNAGASFEYAMLPLLLSEPRVDVQIGYHLEVGSPRNGKCSPWQVAGVEELWAGKKKVRPVRKSPKI